MTITFKDVVKLAKGAHSIPALRSVVFDGKSAIVVSELDWVVGVPCVQPAITSPVVVPVDAILAHLAKSRHLVVTPEHLTNGQGLVTPFNKPAKWDDAVLDLMPAMPEQEAVSFELDLDALDRVLIAAGNKDIRYYMNGVLFDLTDGVLVGSDGHRLHVFKNRVPVAYPRTVVDGVPQGQVAQVILGRAPLHWVVGSASSAAKVTIWNARREGDKPVPALLQVEDGFVWIRNALAGQYPDWNRVVPAVASRPVWFEVNPAKLADAAVAMGKVAHLESKGKWLEVGLNVGGNAVFAGKDAQALPVAMTLHSDRVELDVEALRAELWMGLQAQYLQDVADCVTPLAQWRVDHENTRNASLLVVDGDFFGVVMGIRDPKPPMVAAQVVQPQDAEEETQEAPPEPCPAAVAAMAAQLGAQAVKKAQEGAKKAPRKAKKAAPEPVAEPVEA